jgi:hypothetical protein
MARDVETRKVLSARDVAGAAVDVMGELQVMGRPRKADDTPS